MIHVDRSHQDSMSKKALAGIIIACTIAIISVVLLVHFEPWERAPSAEVCTITTIPSPLGGGSISLADGSYESGNRVILTATAASGYVFDHWDGDASGSSNPLIITMNSNKTVTAHFRLMPPSANLTVHFIDVGQGDSILLDLGDTELLIDGGDKSPGVVNYISQYVDGPLEVMVATHPHADHIGGLIGVLNDFEVDEIWLNGETSTSQTYSQFMSAVNSEGADVHIARRGDTIHAGNLTFSVLSPVSLGSDTNDNSIVLSLSYGQVDFLFTGDAEQEAEASMLSAGIVPDVDILKVGHHGSRTASSLQFLHAAKPEVAIYMAGVGNSYGHPHQETICNLREVGADIYGTDAHGTIIITTDGATYSILPSNNVPSVDCLPTITYDLTIGVNGQGSTSPGAGTYEYDTGAEATVSASPASGWNFDHWSGDVSGTSPTSPTITIIMDSDKDITAYFGKIPVTELEIVSVTSPVSPGAYATLRARAPPGAQCTITVYYKSGPSTAQGLYSKQADTNGDVSWTWKVGTRTTPGSWRIVVTATYEGQTVSQETYFTVS